MPCMACRTGADGAIQIGLANGMTRFATGCDGGLALQHGQGVGWTIYGASMIAFRKFDLSLSKRGTAPHSSKRRRSMPAAQKLVVLLRMALLAIERRYLLGQLEPSMIEGSLPLSGTVAIQAVGSHASMIACLVFGDDGGRLPPVACRTLSRRSDEFRRRLLDFYGRTPSMKHERRNHEGRPNEDRDEDRFEGVHTYHEMGWLPEPPSWPSPGGPDMQKKHESTGL